MSETTPRLALPLVQPAQAMKHVTVNEALLAIDALIRAVAQSRTETVPPADPEDGACWIRPAGAVDAAWDAAPDGALMQWRDGGWIAHAPEPGWRVWILDEARPALWIDGVGWQAAPPQHVLAATAAGATMRACIAEIVVDDLTGASLVTDPLISPRSLLLGVSLHVEAALSGTSAFACGIAGQTDKFGSGIAIAAGTQHSEPVTPEMFSAHKPVVLTAADGAFTGGRIRLAAHVLELDAPGG